ncbi:MAG: alpha-L-fucosidase [Lachnospiraceae bacterium]|nr:alpha-L-fucosidase [Lachnospiraceae bacterium]
MKITDKHAYLKQIDDVIAKGPYHDDWASLTDFIMPSWYEKAKFGIFIHWGLYSVPAFNNEWYSRNMYIQGTPEFEHHVKTYGLHKDFGYKDFIPMFTAEKFDPDFWAETFAHAGAKYVVPVAEHHDGFQMYQSDLSIYNAANMGPKRDILGELKTAFEKMGLVFCTSSHRAEHHWFMGNGKDFESDIREPLHCGDFYWPSERQQPDQQDLFAKPYPDKEFLEDWLCRTCEIIDRYQPKILYFDWWIQHEAYKPYLRKIAAYYYNRGLEWGFHTAICYKHDAMAFGSGIVDIERGKFADARPYHWQTDTAIARNSWCYTTSLDYKSSYEIICYLIDVVSKNGNLLLNVGPKADGSFAEKDAAILKDIGDWLTINGESIYNSKPWRYPAEGPTKETEGQFSDGTASSYTSEDFRFTAGNGCIYATCLNYPEDGKVTIHSLSKSRDANKPNFHGIIRKVEVLGFPEGITYIIDEDGLHFTTQNVESDFPVVIRIQTE